MNNTYIYSLSDPISGQIKYIGKSNYPKIRYANHLRRANKVHLKKQNWIDFLKNLGLKPQMNIVDEIPISEWEFWGRHYISLYRSWGFELLNVTKGGGHDTTGIKHSDESKKIMSEKAKIRMRTPEKRQRMREISTGRKLLEETVKKMREVQSRISTRSKAVLQFDADMNFLAKFSSGQKASKITGDSFRAISTSTRKHHVTQHGFIWKLESDKHPPYNTGRIKKGLKKFNLSFKRHIERYANFFSPSALLKKKNNIKLGRQKFGLIMKEKFNDPEYKQRHLDHLNKSREKQKKAVSQFNLNGDFIKTYESMHEAGRACGFDFKKISACVTKKQKTHRNFIWKLA